MHKQHFLYNYLVHVPILLLSNVLLLAIAIIYNVRWLVILTCVSLIFLIFFFRNMKIDTSQYHQYPFGLVSPSSGEITNIKKIEDGNESRMLIRTHVHVWDRHYYVSPCDGIIVGVEENKLRKGDAERAIITILITGENGQQERITVEPIVRRIGSRAWLPKTVFKRVIVSVKLGDHVKRGERLGMIRFGSRMETTFPRHHDIVCKVRETISVGETFLTSN